jgi:Protein of unknown function (DUF1579)
MRNIWSSALALSLVGMMAAPAAAQQPPKPGPEHEFLKEMAGTWDCTVKFMGQESKGTMVYKMGLGGLWLLSSFDGEFGGQKFEGSGMDSYDPAKKKFVSVWADSMVATPMLSEGTYDKAARKLTMLGEGPPGPDGKPTKSTSVTEYKDPDTMIMTMSGPGPDGKEAVMMTITFKRKK